MFAACKTSKVVKAAHTVNNELIKVQYVACLNVAIN